MLHRATISVSMYRGRLCTGPLWDTLEPAALPKTVHCHGSLRHSIFRFGYYIVRHALVVPSMTPTSQPESLTMRSTWQGCAGGRSGS
jgi:hypothetical protein